MVASVKNRERMVGVFVLLTLIVIAAILLGVISRERLFRKEVIVKTLCDQRYNLSVGSPVAFQGFGVGHVHKMDLRGPNEVEVRLAVLEDYARFISNSSTIAVETSPIGAIVSDRVLIVPPVQPPGPIPLEDHVPDRIRDGDQLRFRKSKSLVDEANAVIDLVKTDILPNIVSITSTVDLLLLGLNDPSGELKTLLRQLSELTGSLNKTVTELTDTANKTVADLTKNVDLVVGDARALTQRLGSMLERTDHIVAGLENGEGVVGAALRDPKMKADLQGTAAQVHELTEKLTASIPKMLLDVEAAIASLRGLTLNAERASDQVPTLLRSLEASLENTNDVLAAVKNHWLLRGSAPEVPPTETLSTSPRVAPGGHP